MNEQQQLEAVRELRGLPWGDLLAALNAMDLGLAVAKELSADDLQVWEADVVLERRIPDELTPSPTAVEALSPSERAALLARVVETVRISYRPLRALLWPTQQLAEQGSTIAEPPAYWECPCGREPPATATLLTPVMTANSLREPVCRFCGREQRSEYRRPKEQPTSQQQSEEKE